MNQGTEGDGSKTRVVLPRSCILKDATDVKAMLTTGLDAGGDVELDARTVERVDTSVLQLLVAFVRDMQEAGRATSWAGSSEELRRSARQLGLAGVLNLLCSG